MIWTKWYNQKLKPTQIIQGKLFSSDLLLLTPRIKDIQTIATNNSVIRTELYGANAKAFYTMINAKNSNT
jgi:hypothetical protein